MSLKLWLEPGLSTENIFLWIPTAVTAATASRETAAAARLGFLGVVECIVCFVVSKCLASNPVV